MGVEGLGLGGGGGTGRGGGERAKERKGMVELYSHAL